MIDEKFDTEPKFEYTDQLPKIDPLEVWAGNINHKISAEVFNLINEEMQKTIRRGEAVVFRCSEETERKLYDYYVRKLLKSRVKRIKIDTWE